MIRRLLKSVREYKRATLLTPLFMALEVAMEMYIPFKMADLIDIGFENGDVPYIIQCGVIIVISAMLCVAFGVGGAYFGTKAAAGFAKNLRADMYRNIQNFSFSNIDKFSTSSIITRLTTDVTNVQQAYQMTIRMAIRTPMSMLFAFFMTLAINWKIAIIYVVIVPILALVLIGISRIVFPIFGRMFKKMDKLNNVTQENLHGVRVVKSFVRRDFENRKFGETSKEVYELNTKAELILAWNNPIMMFSMYLAMLLIFWFGSMLVVSHAPVTLSFMGTELTTGLLNSLASYSMTLLMNCMMLSMIFVILTISRESMVRIDEILQETTDIRNPEHPVTEVKNGEVVFENMDFSYAKDPDKLALSGVNIRIPSGSVVGVIGGTGSAKSTLVQLIPRLYDVTRGLVKVGGVDVREYDLEVLRDAVSMVLQKNVLFAGTIKDNMRWGNAQATDEEIIHACELACADEFIKEREEGYDAMIEQGGANVSGGQRQRLCIARALLKKPKVLILDDSTSAVDTATDAKIRRAFREEIPDTTRIIIAQRITSVQDADMIIVLDDGKVNAVGTHEELLASNEIYREVYESQKKGGLEDGK